VRGNGFLVGVLLVVATLLAIMGVLQLTRALPKPTIAAAGAIVASTHDPGGRYSGESWNVYLSVAGHGSQVADSHALYDVVQHADPLAAKPVTVHMRGSLVTAVDYRGRRYGTSAVSTTEAWIEAVVLLALCALTLGGVVRIVRRGPRSG
jgi:hypothetical protein